MSVAVNRPVAGPRITDDARYLRRSADIVLDGYLRGRKWVALIGPPRLGKTSALDRSRRVLTTEDTKVAYLSFRDFQTEASSQWFERVLDTIVRQVPEAEAAAAGAPPEQPGQVRSWMLALLRGLARVGDRQPVALLFDEFNELTQLPVAYRSELLTALDLMREEEDGKGRLQVLFAGLVDPRDLGDGSGRFGVERLWFGEFSWEELLPLRALLDERLRNGDAWMKAILHWTGGHPFFTQWCCERLLRDSEIVESSPPKVVESLVLQGLLGGDSGQPHQLLAEMGSEFIRCVTRTTDRLDLLEAYQSILDGVDLELNWDEPAHRWLRVLGYVRVERISSAEYLRVRNRLVETCYNLSWVRRSFAEVQRPYVTEVVEWRPSERADKFDALTLLALEERIDYFTAGESSLSKKEGRYLLALRGEHGRRRAVRRRWIGAFFALMFALLGAYTKSLYNQKLLIEEWAARHTGTSNQNEAGTPAIRSAIRDIRQSLEDPLRIDTELATYSLAQRNEMIRAIRLIEYSNDQVSNTITTLRGDRQQCEAEKTLVLNTQAQQRDYFERRISQLNTQLSAAQNHNDERNNALTTALNNLDAGTIELQYVRGRLDASTRELDEVRGRLDASTRELEQARNQFDACRRELAEVRDRLDASTRELEEARGRLSRQRDAGLRTVANSDGWTPMEPSAVPVQVSPTPSPPSAETAPPPESAPADSSR